MNWKRLLYPVFTTRPDGAAETFVGNAFPIDASGGLVTCRHVVDREGSPRVGVYDFDGAGEFRPVHSWRADPGGLDLAYMPSVLPSPRADFYPLLIPEAVWDGADHVVYGFYMVSGQLQRGYFHGRLVSTGGVRPSDDPQVLSLPFPVIEGLSGTPVMTQHRGHKLLGVCFGSRSHRVNAYELTEVQEGETRFREETWRLFEYGLAYHAREVIAFLERIGAEGFIVTDERTHTPALDT
jgi:hypothetical protein